MGTVNINPKYLTYSKDEVQNILDGVAKIDAAPKEGSNYPVSSAGVKEALDQLGGDTMQVAENEDPMSLLDN